MFRIVKNLYSIYIIIFSITSFLSTSNLFASKHVQIQNTNESLQLTDKEKTFLKNLKIIKKCVDPLWMPLEEINLKGEHIGVIADILHIVEEKLGIKTELVPTSNWPESIEKLNTRKCDIVTSDTIDNNNDKAIRTMAYMVERNVYITRKSTPLQLDFSAIKHKTIGIPRGYPTINLIKKKYGKVNFVEVNSVDKGLLMLSRGELYAFTDILSICSYSIEKQRLSNLQVAGHLDITVPITMSVRSDMPELVVILNKALKTIDKVTINTLYSKWIKLEYNVIIDWKILIKYAVLILLVLAFVLYWIRKLYLLNCKLNKANAQLELLNETDTLSKMKNRNFILFQLPLLMKLAHRNGDSFNIAIFDIDKFKHLNDTFGHDVGDKCIIAISHKVHTIFHREDDWNIRYGGDEFLIVSFGVSKEDFKDKLHILKDEVEHLILDSTKHIPCSISIGYTYHPLSPKKWNERFIAEADKKLYEAKALGRNIILGI